MPIDRALQCLADCVRQHFHCENGVYDSGFIRSDKEAIVTLIEAGIMEEVTVGMIDDPYRWIEARFKENR